MERSTCILRTVTSLDVYKRQDLRAAATRTTFLRNVLMRVPEYRQSLSVIKAPAGEEARPFTHFVRMESPVFKPAPADTAIQFPIQPVADAANRHWDWIGAIQLGSAGAPVIAEADGREVRLSTGATPVSYTHLDVYKRQLPHFRPSK